MKDCVGPTIGLIRHDRAVVVFVIGGDDVHLSCAGSIEYEVEYHWPVRAHESLDDEAIHIELLWDLRAVFAEMPRGVFRMSDERPDDDPRRCRACCDRWAVVGAVGRVAGIC